MMHTIKIYKMWWNDCEDLYIGSTKNTLSRRMAQHRLASKTKKYNIHKAIIKNGEFNYVLLESYEVKDNDEKLKWEQHWIDKLIPNLNKIRCHNTIEDTKYIKKIYTANIKDIKKKYDKEYRKKNKKYISNRDRIRKQKNKKTILCHCGGSYNYANNGDKNKHYKTIKHKSFNAMIKGYELSNN